MVHLTIGVGTDAPICHSAGADGAPQGFPPFRRRFAALTRAIRSPLGKQLSERRQRAYSRHRGSNRTFSQVEMSKSFNIFKL